MLRSAWRVIVPSLVVAIVASHHAIADAPDAVQLDVIATSSDGQPIGGLTDRDFEVREDGRPVTIDGAEEIGSATSAATRTIVLILDDSAVPARLTTRVQQIARMVVTRTAPGDRVNVVRFNRRGEEPVGDQAASLSRIAGYAAGVVPFFGRETFENALGQVARLSRALAGVEDRRKEIVAIGSPGVFDVREPVPGRNSLIWPSWVDALAAASRANAAVYVIDPAGVTGRLKLIDAAGLVADTGGTGFYNSADFEKAVDRIWRDAGNYYLVRYSPARSARELHDVRVSVAKPGVRVQARRARG